MTQQHPRDECYFCGSDEQIESHHILPARFGGPDIPDNLVDVCRECHEKLERIYDKEFWEKIEISKAEHEPNYRSLDDEDTEEWQPTVWPDQSLDEITPQRCIFCQRMGPFQRSTQQPSGRPIITCARCDGALVITGREEYTVNNVVDIVEILEETTVGDDAFASTVVKKAVEHLGLTETEARSEIDKFVEQNELRRPKEQRLRIRERNDEQITEAFEELSELIESGSFPESNLHAENAAVKRIAKQASMSPERFVGEFREQYDG